MKIKTIVHDQPDDFDTLVNEALEEGYLLEHRDVLPGTTVKVGHYARLVLPDPAPEPEEADPIEALRTVQDFCMGRTCDSCPLAGFCVRHLANQEGPADWELPGEGDDL